MENQQPAAAENRLLDEQAGELDIKTEVGVESIGDTLIDSMPPVTDHSGSGAPTPGDPAVIPPDEKSQDHYFDTENPPDDFNPYKYNSKYHQPGPEGEGIRNTNKTFRRKGGRPSKKKNPAGPDVQSTVNIPGNDQPGQNSDTDPGKPFVDPELQVAALTASNLFFTVGQALGGPEWQPSPEERDYHMTVWMSYFESAGVTEIPPKYLLLVAMGSFSLQRFQQPQTQSRLSVLWGKTKIGFLVLRNKFSRKGGAVNAHTDSRNDDEREKHSSEADN